ncbi:hypothetical protein [Bradyrhizobium liaoningense]|uniref:hypothetical protein n=1 Tax=Bradyrhizobium liaoningense TaxID=43992 RepID=UPI001BABF7A9|nr:hypothetical protein [Bradyrhizobium liaoningense]MBR0855875.1 hypothetical protein [Bradyrhizobium liaoningense]
MSTRALACVVAWIVALPQATRNVDLLTEKNSGARREIAGCRQSRRSCCELDERCRGRRRFRSRTTGVSIHYAIESQKDLAGASIEFDIRQTAINDAT